MEVRIIDKCDEQGRGLPAKARTGSIWGGGGGAKRAALGPGRWKTVEITCRGDLTCAVANAITTEEVDASRRSELTNLPQYGFIDLENIRGQGRGVECCPIRVEGLY